MARFFFDTDVRLDLLHGRTIAVLGYGNQGRVQALNLRDGGFTVVVGNRADACADRARADGFAVLSLAEAATLGDYLLLLIADEAQPAVYAADIAPHLRPGQTLVFGSGFNVYYGLIRPPAEVDVVMVAPEMIGVGVRENFLNHTGFSCLIGVEQDASGLALDRAVALAGAIGSTRMGALLSSFEEETLVDLMYEHSGILYHIRRVIEVLVAAGVSPEAAIIGFYASGEESRLTQAYANLGLWHQLPLHSRTSQYGQEVTSQLSPEAEAAERAHLNAIIANVRSGQFARDWQQEQAAGYPTWRRIRRQNVAHPIIQAERALYRQMGRLPADAVDDSLEVYE